MPFSLFVTPDLIGGLGLRFSPVLAAGQSAAVRAEEKRKSQLAGYLPPGLLRDKEGPAGPGEDNPREPDKTLFRPNRPWCRPENNPRVLVASH